MRTLRQCLLDCDLALLRVIAERWALDLSTNRQHAAAVALADHMAAPEAQLDLAAALTPAEREALQVLLAADGQMPVGAFTRRFGEIRLMGPGRLERKRPWVGPQGVAESLWYAGLIYLVFDEGPGGMQEVVYIPPELRAGLQAGASAPSTDAITLPRVPAPEPIEPRAAGIADDVCTLLAYAHQHALAPPPCDEAWQRRHASLLAQLGGPERDYVEFLIHLARRAGLLRLDEQRLRPEAERSLDWLRAGAFEQLRTLFEAWRDDPTWNELWRVPGLRCEDTGSWHNDPLAARRTTLEYVRLMRVEEWYSLEGLVAAVKQRQPDFQRPGGDYDTWYVRDVESGEYLCGFDSWDKVDGALLRYVLAGPLAWLEAVRTSPAGGLALTGLGAALLGQGQPPAGGGDARFEVAPDGEVRVGAARRYERFQLSRVADWLRVEAVSSAGPEPAGSLWVYQLTPSSLKRAGWQRIGVERVLEFLEDSAGQPVPELLAKALRRWAERGVEAWADRVVVLRLASPELLEHVMSHPSTRHLVREPLSSTRLAVLPQHWPALRQALLAMGVLVEESST